MTPTEIKAKFPNASDSFIKRNLGADYVAPANTNPAIVQELQAVNPGQEHRQAKDIDIGQDKTAHGRAGGRYRLRVVFLVADKRRRDAFGMLETVADTFIRAIRRFNSGNPMR